jgi:hypothetical protein
MSIKVRVKMDGGATDVEIERRILEITPVGVTVQFYTEDGLEWTPQHINFPVQDAKVIVPKNEEELNELLKGFVPAADVVRMRAKKSDVSHLQGLVTKVEPAATPEAPAPEKVMDITMKR